MTRRVRIPLLLALASALLLAPATLARADQAYDKVASAYAQAGGQLDPCQFTQAELEAAVRGIPPAIRTVVPDLRRAMLDGIAAHMRGDCAGQDGGSAAGGAGTTTAPTTPTAPAPVTTETAPAAPPPTATTAPTTPAPSAGAPATTAPAPATTSAQPAATTTQRRDRTPLWIALIALGALALLALLAWGWARMRGWDSSWAARARHSWGEAGFRTASTWAEFTDWLRLGR